MIIEYDHPTVGKVATTGFTIKFSESPQAVYRPAPLLGQHTSEILEELCYNKEEIVDIMNNGR
jgi:crotonobetainyl-CoA:carnitine CoA-transferase CaiB-like acyl-CoA transferase